MKGTPRDDFGRNTADFPEEFEPLTFSDSPRRGNVIAVNSVRKTSLNVRNSEKKPDWLAAEASQARTFLSGQFPCNRDKYREKCSGFALIIPLGGSNVSNGSVCAETDQLRFFTRTGNYRDLTEE